jgi:hypothetical protein
VSHRLPSRFLAGQSNRLVLRKTDNGRLDRANKGPPRGDPLALLRKFA